MEEALGGIKGLREPGEGYGGFQRCLEEILWSLRGS